MGFYVRKSLSAGPFRYNLSKSGVGVSAGIRGFRFGTGPRGNYVRAGRGGVYYRATLGGGRHRAGEAKGGPQRIRDTEESRGDSVPMEDVTGASATELVSTGADDLVSQLNAAARRPPLAWLAALAVPALALAVGGGGAVALVVLGIFFVVWVWLRDGARRAVVVFYDVEDDHARWFTELVDTFGPLAEMRKVWRVSASGSVQTTHQYKVHSGASNVVERITANVGCDGPKLLRTNILVPSITAGRQAMYFLPDRLLVRHGRRFSDMQYGALRSTAHPQRFIEGDRVPKDAERVDTTWQYVNVKGGPDRRFKNNRKLPVMLYGKIDLSAESGLHWILQCSRVPPAEKVAKVLRCAPTAAAALQ